MAHTEINIALLGFGTVGRGVFEVLRENKEEIEEKIGTSIYLKKILVRNIQKYKAVLQQISPREKNLPILTDDIQSILNDEEISLIVEVMGGIVTAKEYIEAALKKGKSVVTANKDVLAEFGDELFKIAEEKKVDFLFEASVGGGIPIISPFKTSLTANKITEVMGILNGTTNYMLTKMTEEKKEYAEVLKNAQDLGYAEANPAADVEGLDAARKATILAMLAFRTKVKLKDVSVEGIVDITSADINYAGELGYVIKLLAIARNSSDKGVEVLVHPTLLPKRHPLAMVNDVYNAIFIHGNAIGDVMFYGQGAGARPTASAVIADVVEAARDILKNSFGRISYNFLTAQKICPLAESKSTYYVRLLVEDKPGVLGVIATEFGKQGVSLSAVIQKKKVENMAEIVAITHKVTHSQIILAKEALQKLSVVSDVRNILRVITC